MNSLERSNHAVDQQRVALGIYFWNARVVALEVQVRWRDDAVQILVRRARGALRASVGRALGLFELRARSKLARRSTLQLGRVVGYGRCLRGGRAIGALGTDAVRWRPRAAAPAATAAPASNARRGSECSRASRRRPLDVSAGRSSWAISWTLLLMRFHLSSTRPGSLTVKTRCSRASCDASGVAVGVRGGPRGREGGGAELGLGQVRRGAARRRLARDSQRRRTSTAGTRSVASSRRVTRPVCGESPRVRRCQAGECPSGPGRARAAARLRWMPRRCRLRQPARSREASEHARRGAPKASLVVNDEHLHGHETSNRVWRERQVGRHQPAG